MTSFKQLPYVAQIGIVTLVILLLAGGAYWYSLLPLQKANQADELTLKSKQAEVARLTPYKAKLAELNAQTESLKAKIDAQKNVVPEEEEVPSLITLVDKEAAAAGVEVRRYTPKETTAKEYYVEVPFEVDLDGPYYAVLNFYDRIQKLERVVNVSHLGMGALKGGKMTVKKSYKWAPHETVAASCILTTFYSAAKGAAPPPAAKKK